MFQCGLEENKDIISYIYDNAKYFKNNGARLKSFIEIVQMFQLSIGKHILDYRTWWNSTFKMLSKDLQFKVSFQDDKQNIYIFVFPYMMLIRMPFELNFINLGVINKKDMILA